MSACGTGLDRRARVAQSAFRRVLEAMAHPGILASVPLTQGASLKNACLETLILMLCDSNTSFCVVGEAKRQLSLDIARLTRAKQLPPDASDFVIISADTSPEEAARCIERLAGGSILAPERSATLLLECQLLSAEQRLGATGGFCLRGPGIETNQIFFASSDIWQRTRAQRDDEFPCGIDFILYDASGTVVCVPRTSEVQALGQTG